MNGNDTKKRGLGALDIMIIVLVLVVAGSAGARYFRTHTSGGTKTTQLENYIISFQVKNIRYSSAENYLVDREKDREEGEEVPEEEKNEVFYLDENGQPFGTFLKRISIGDAQKFYEMPDGTVTLVTSHLKEEQRRVDVEASVTAEGSMTKEGCFLLNGSRYIVVNDEIKIHSKNVAFTILITGITKAQ